MKLPLEGKLALVTGASRGIGAAIARRPADGPMADAQKKLTSLGRYGKPDEIACAVAFLASPQSAFINGECLTVDGGWNA